MELGNLHRSLNNPNAIKFYTKALELSKKQFGVNHPHTNTIKCISETYEMPLQAGSSNAMAETYRQHGFLSSPSLAQVTRSEAEIDMQPQFDNN